MKTINLILFNITYTLLGIASLVYFGLSWEVLVMWLLFAFGNGTIGHRYFAHNQFKVGKIRHWIFAFWCTISAYSTISYWQVQHRHHHRHSDDETDIHSPKNGILMSMVGWPYSKERIESVFKERASSVNYAKGMKDTAVKFTSENFIAINVLFLLTLYFIDAKLLVAAPIAFLIEHLRLGVVNSLLHINGIPGNYRNHETKDRSQNNILLGLLSLGFGWHNNHHHDASKLILTEKFWEIDLEGYLGKILSLNLKEEKNGKSTNH
jgi:stearoyl-CoA desaturase (delta-9 desaturase)